MCRLDRNENALLKSLVSHPSTESHKACHKIENDYNANYVQIHAYLVFNHLNDSFFNLHIFVLLAHANFLKTFFETKFRRVSAFESSVWLNFPESNSNHNDVRDAKKRFRTMYSHVNCLFFIYAYMKIMFSVLFVE